MLMGKSIIIDGKEFISAIRAAKKVGYAGDYVGQLCRAKKIPAQLIGKTWYVDYLSLVEYKKNYKSGRKKNRLPVVQTAIREETKIVKEKIPEIISSISLNNDEITYEKEQMSRLPELIKKGAKSSLKINKPALSKVYLSLALFLVLFIGLTTIRSGLVSFAPVAKTYDSLATTLAYSQEPAFVSFALDWFRKIFYKEKELAPAPQPVDNSNNTNLGLVVFPDAEDRLEISNRIKGIFSDNVEINLDEEGNTGVIVPVFSEKDDFENYAFVLVPVPASSPTPSPDKKL